jgi:hypothetical protein
MGVATCENIWEVGVAGTGQDLASSEAVQNLCQAVESEAHVDKKEESELIEVSELIDI